MGASVDGVNRLATGAGAGELDVEAGGDVLGSASDVLEGGFRDGQQRLSRSLRAALYG
jgi:hypothetical protein